MGAGFHGGFGDTAGCAPKHAEHQDKRKKMGGSKPKDKIPIFSKEGRVTLKSIKERREFFFGKSVARIENELHRHGYETKRRPSVHSGSKAKIIESLNSSKDRNVTQVQVSPGSSRHGNVPYVKISTSDIGVIKIINAHRSEYKTDGKETATLLFRRYKR